MGAAFWAGWWFTLLLAISANVVLMPHHPCFCLIFLVGVGPLLLHALHKLVYHEVADIVWCQVGWKVLMAPAMLCLLAWLLWIAKNWHMGNDGAHWSSAVNSLRDQHKIDWKCAFVMWIAPPIASLELGLLACLYFKYHQYLTVHDVSTRSQVVALQLKQIVAGICGMALLFWILAVLAKQQKEFEHDFVPEVIGIMLFATVSFTIWTLTHISHNDVKEAIKKENSVEEVVWLLQSDWTKAFLLLVAGPFIVAYDFCSYCFHFRTHLLAGWRWTSVLVKASIIGQLMILGTLLSTAFFPVFMGMFCEQLRGWSLHWVSFMVFAVTFLICMTPTSPNPLLYMVTGWVICRSAFEEGWSFWSAVAWATFLAFVMKMSSSALTQIGIGGALAENKSVRHACMLHTPLVRAMEMILASTELSTSLVVAKVSLFVGPPNDWAVAVLCGILKVRLMPVLVFMSPVLVSVFLFVLSGAVLVEFGNNSDEDVHKVKALAGPILVIAGILSSATSIVALYYVQDTLDKNYEELHKVRPEDQWMADLDKEEAEREVLFEKATVFDKLPLGPRLLLVLGLVCVEISVCLLCLPIYDVTGVRTFKEYDYTDSIQDKLGGNVLNLVEPLGWVAITFALLNLVILGIYHVWLQSVLKDRIEKANAALDEESKDDETTPLVRPPGKGISRQNSVLTYSVS